MRTSGAVEVVMDAGLGNEMFQYALGRALALRYNRPLILDTSRIVLSPGWGFDLPCFRLGLQRVRELPYALWSLRQRLLRGCRRLGVEPKAVVDESSLLFCKEILELDKPCILCGYWQSERYFESVAAELREEFTIIRAQDPQSAECQARIREVNSIGLHVRRGDYLVGPGEEDFHGTCPREYYDAALKMVRSRLGDGAELFVFSDDIEWTRENIRYPLRTVYVDWNSKRDYEDLRLMSECRALIMANSSFSWWAGWLNRREDKVVVAPRKWYRAPGAVSDLPNSPWIIAI